MSKLILETIRDELKAQKIIDAEGEFCRDWLGKSECYLRTLRFTNGEPSADALSAIRSWIAVCQASVPTLGDDLTASIPDDFVKQRQTDSRVCFNV